MKTTKTIPVKKVRQYYKRFAQGEQYIKLTPFGIEVQDKQYWWQDIKVFNHVAPLISLYGKDLTEDELYGRYGLVSLLEPYQREYNRIMNLHNEHIRYATYGYMAVEDGSVDTDELSEDGLMPGKIIIYRQGSRLPEFEKDTLDTNPYIESAKYCLDQMYRIAIDFRDTHLKEETVEIGLLEAK